MNPALYRWQTRTLISLETPELVAVAQLLDQLHASRTGDRMMTDRAHAACSRQLLCATIMRLDQLLERYRPLGTPRLPGPASPTPTG